MAKTVERLESFDLTPSGSGLGVSQFTYSEFIEFWPKLEKMLDTVPHTWKHWTKESIYRTIELGEAQIWGAGPPLKAVLILMTTISTYPAMKVLNIVWAAGHMPPGMFPVLDATFVNFAQLNDCTAMEIRGRMGWGPHLKKLGFEQDAAIWSKPIQSMRMN